MATTPSKSAQRRVERLTGYMGDVMDTLNRMDEGDFIQRLWHRDATLWTTDEAHQKNIGNSLGWLNVAVPMRRKADDLVAFAAEIKDAGFTDAVLLGMGGSSLCPEVLRRVFGSKPGYPTLHVLDSTVPGAVLALERRIHLATTLFIVASKSGSTIEPQMFFRYFHAKVKELKGEQAGQHFIAITDPGTAMETLAKEAGFRRIFLNAADIGGRFSALSNFGMVPAALLGVDIRVLLDRALHSVHFCSANTPTLGMPAARRGAVMGTLANAGRDKMTLILQPELESFGLWIEQLVAESTGKDGKGIIPICGEPLAAPSAYGDDRFFVFVHYREYDNPEIEAKLDALTTAGHPSLRIILNEHINIGEELFLWEFATALAGALMQINPFDQPNVQESKLNSVAVIDTFTKTGKLPEQELLYADGSLSFYGPAARFGAPSSAVASVKALLGSVKPNDYVALMQFLAESDEVDASVQTMRTSIRDRLKVATTTGYGPRFLHSTGQLHKGGADNGVFLQITADDTEDASIPGETVTFSVLKQAQAIGDFQSLLDRNRRAMRVHIKGSVAEGLKRLDELVREALV